MKDINDKDFDQTFRQRVTESFPEFEEESWLKMERKLRKKDRLVFYRNASIILLLLSFGLGTYFFTQKGQKDSVKPQSNIVKSKTKIQKKEEASTATIPITPSPQTTAPTLITSRIIPKTIENKKITSQIPILPSAIDSMPQKSSPTDLLIANTQITIVSPSQNTHIIEQITNLAIAAMDTVKVAKEPIKTSKRIRKIPISLAISAGPDFNSTAALIGGNTSASLGISVGIGLTKKISVQTGLIYGSKNYSANGYDYTFNNPSVQSLIETIHAKCKVFEIPLRASYNLVENQKRSIELNGGLSSYFMLKENYVYKYTAAANRDDRTREFINANQHFLSVLDLSATYNIKLKNKKMALGIEPYVKIPLSGIGEGSVPLKSSGVAFKLRYNFNTKQYKH